MNALRYCEYTLTLAAAYREYRFAFLQRRLKIVVIVMDEKLTILCMRYLIGTIYIYIIQIKQSIEMRLKAATLVG